VLNYTKKGIAKQEGIEISVDHGVKFGAGDGPREKLHTLYPLTFDQALNRRLSIKKKPKCKEPKK